MTQSLTNSDKFNWGEYNNFVENGYKYTNPNTAGIIPETKTETTENPDPFLDSDKKTKIMFLLGKLWTTNEINRFRGK